jgi:hypothetical protein
MRSCRFASLALRFAAHSFTIRCVVYNAYMGSRGRQREREHQAQAHGRRDRMARVQVSDETWASYRASLGSVPGSQGIGRLIERGVASHRRRTALDADAVRVAVQDARVVADEQAMLIARLEARA